MKHKILLSLLALGSLCLAADSLTVSAPLYGESVSVMNSGQRMFTAMPESMLRPLLDDRSFCQDLCTSIQTYPSGICFKWTFKGKRADITYRMTIADNPELKDAKVYTPAHSSFQLQNLMPGTTYYWKTAAVYKNGDVIETPVSNFTVSTMPPRVMYVPGVTNCRDLGGWTGLEGRKVAFNKIFRNTGLNNNSADGKVPGKPRFDADGEKVLKELMKIRTDLDLRSERETAKMTQSPLGPEVNFINISSTCYAGLYTDYGRDNYAKLFRVCCDEKNYPIDIHCIGGADRTGTLCFLLLTTLGVSMDDAGKDYVFTSFMARRAYDRFDSLRDGMNEYGAADEPTVRKAERFLLYAGITPAEIMTFRDIMLGKGTQPGPVLEQAMELEKIQKDSDATPVEGINLAWSAVPVKAQWLCGTEISFAKAGDWRARGIKTFGDTKGGNRFLIYPVPNRRNLAIRPDISKKFGDKQFMVGDLLSKTVFTSAAGKDVLTGPELETLSLPPWNSAIFLQFSPVDANPLPADWKRVKADFTPQYACLETAPMTAAPVLDGDVTDDAWSNIPAQKLLPCIAGQPDAGNTVKLLLDAKADTLYLAGSFKDRTPYANHMAHDSAVYDDDCCEIFLSDQNSLSFRQLAINRKGGLYDGWGKDAKWDTKDIVIKTKETADGWTLEMAIPLAQMKFNAPLNINVTYSDSPARTRFNLVPTGGSFHNRQAMLPLIVK